VNVVLLTEVLTPLFVLRDKRQQLETLKRKIKMKAS
jgi:hypothetical protein